MKKSLLIIIFINSIAFAQTNNADNSGIVLKNKYLKFLLLPDSSSQTRMFTAGIQYLHTTTYKTLKPGGMHVSLGFNLARFFTKQHILGVFVDLKGIKGFTKQKFSNEFISDFNASFNTNYNTQEDSARAYLLKDHINSSTMYGNYMGDVGIMFSLFPQKYGGLMLAVKKGYRSYVIHGIYGDKYIGNGEKEIALFDLKNNYAFELSTKPYSFFKNSFLNGESNAINEILKLVTLTFYYEQTNLQSATIEKLPLENIVSKNFMDKYGKTNMYGFKIGLTIY